jgi:hypothetical protein
MASVLGRLENWVLGENALAGDLFASDLRVETPDGVSSALRQPHNVRMLVSGGNDEFGSIIYEHQDADSGLWRRSCLIYFADGGRIHQVYDQHSAVPGPGDAATS